MGIIAWIVLSLGAGLLANMLIPGGRSQGLILTCVAVAALRRPGWRSAGRHSRRAPVAGTPIQWASPPCSPWHRDPHLGGSSRRMAVPRLTSRTVTAGPGCGARDPPDCFWAVRARRCPPLGAARNRRFCGGIPSCPAAAHLECGRIARSRRGARGRAGDLGPGRPGPTPAEPPRGSASVKVAQGKGNPEGNRRGTGTGQRPKGTNRRTPDEGKPEKGGRRGRTRRATGKPEESPQGKPEDVR